MDKVIRSLTYSTHSPCFEHLNFLRNSEVETSSIASMLDKHSNRSAQKSSRAMKLV